MIERKDVINVINEEDFAGKLYAIYCVEVGGKAFNGDPLPDWKTFRADPSKKKQSDAWVAVGRAARDQFLKLENPVKWEMKTPDGTTIYGATIRPE
jgi:hypothetical protein